jgi:Protein of unknown function (DUF1559)/Domain of unknown function (DUF4190)
MAISFSCECGQQLQAKEEHAGRLTRCPKCGSDVMIPSIEPAPPPETAARPEAVTPRPRPDVSHLEDDWEERRRRRPAVTEATSNAAIVSLVLGILSVLCLGVPSIPAIIVGIVALLAISRSRGRLGGQGLAVGGIVLGVVGLVVLLPVLLLVPAVQKVRGAAMRINSQNNLKQIAIGMHNFHSTYNEFPPAVVYDRDGKPLYSWRVLLLPYVEEGALYQEFHLDEPWDSPHNKPLLARMPRVYAPPGSPPQEPYATYYHVFDGPGAIFDSDKSKGLRPFNLPGVGPFGVPGPGAVGQPAGPSLMQSSPSRRLVDITDGTSNTIMIVEAGDPVPWTKPADLRWDPNGPLPKLGGLFNGDFNVALADGSVRFISKPTAEHTVRARITANGGEILAGDW